MPQYIPEFWWTWNCGPADDYDCLADWGNLIIQRNNLRYIRTTLNFWNELDDWKQNSKVFTPPNAPTSEPFSVNPTIGYSWCKGSCNSVIYHKKNYKFITLLEIVYGGNGQQQVIDEYTFESDSVSKDLKFCKQDRYYIDRWNCINNLLDC